MKFTCRIELDELQPLLQATNLLKNNNNLHNLLKTKTKTSIDLHHEMKGERKSHSASRKNMTEKGLPSVCKHYAKINDL